MANAFLKKMIGRTIRTDGRPGYIPTIVIEDSILYIDPKFISEKTYKYQSFIIYLIKNPINIFLLY